MDFSLNTEAIILNSRPYREADSLLNIYTKEKGKLSLLARGTKKLNSKMAGHLEPMNLVDLMIIPGKNFDYVASALNKNSRLSLKDDLNKLYYAGKIISLFSSLVKENEKDEKMFFLLNKYLELIDIEDDFDKDKGSLFFIRFSISFLNHLGYRPEMYRCLSCKKDLTEGVNYFDLQNGSVLCSSCGDKIEKNNSIISISDNCIRILRYFIDGKEKRKISFSKKLIKETEELLRKFIIFLS